MSEGIINLDAAEIDTILAALRLYREDGQDVAADPTEEIHGYAPVSHALSEVESVKSGDAQFHPPAVNTLLAAIRHYALNRPADPGGPDGETRERVSGKHVQAIKDLHSKLSMAPLHPTLSLTSAPARRASRANGPRT